MWSLYMIPQLCCRGLCKPWVRSVASFTKEVNLRSRYPSSAGFHCECQNLTCAKFCVTHFMWIRIGTNWVFFIEFELWWKAVSKMGPKHLSIKTSLKQQLLGIGFELYHRWIISIVPTDQWWVAWPWGNIESATRQTSLRINTKW